MIADALLKIPVPSKLRTIVIGRNRLETEGATYLSKAIEIHTGLVCLFILISGTGLYAAKFNSS
jgi:Ran GTPase-activating protein (RanGAP) involved in mRNA processing and transport